MKVSTLASWIAIALVIIGGALTVYRAHIRSEMIAAQNQERIAKITILLDDMIQRSYEMELRLIEARARVDRIETVQEIIDRMEDSD